MLTNMSGLTSMIVLPCRLSSIGVNMLPMPVANTGALLMKNGQSAPICTA